MISKDHSRPAIAHKKRGFTLVELLVVITIVLLISAVTLPVVIPAVAHRQVSEAARILQAALVGARDAAIQNNLPRGIRLLPDPNFTGFDPTMNPTALNPALPLAANRIVPIEPAPDYTDGFVSIFGVIDPLQGAGFPPPYPSTNGGGSYVDIYPGNSGVVPGSVLMVEEAVYDFNNNPNPPTSWFWNIRIGDKIRINNTGNYYTVVGPMSIPNPELFVNVGDPGTTSPLLRHVNIGGSPVATNPEFLFLVNGQDDNQDGFVDNGWDGVDNNNNGIVDDILEWQEAEKWTGALALQTNVTYSKPYTISRRPIPSPGAREIQLPSGVVVDLTTWGLTRERSRLPIDRTTGFVDIMLNPNGEVIPTTEYSSPSSFGMDGAFFHFWLAERSDLAAPIDQRAAGVPYLLPMPSGSANYPNTNDANPTRELKGERRLVTLFTKTGQILVNDLQSFDGAAPFFPFLSAQQGVRGASQ